MMEPHRPRSSLSHEPEPLPPAPDQRAVSAPFVVVERPAPRRDPLDLLLRVLAGVVLLLVVAMLGAMFLLLTSLMSLSGGVGAGLNQVGAGLGRTVQGAGDAVGAASQSLADRMDPAHPPRGNLVYDAEFDELRVIQVGERLGRTEEHSLTLVDIRKRADASDPNQAHYAVVRSALLQPRETRVLGVVVRTERDEREQYLYKGESIRVGREYFKVNWVSAQRQAAAIARYRDADRLTAPVKLEVE